MFVYSCPILCHNSDVTHSFDSRSPGQPALAGTNVNILDFIGAQVVVRAGAVGRANYQ